MKTTIKSFALSLSLAALALTSYGQEETNKDFQITFISPLGTNGINSHLYTNKVSINLLAGTSAANTAFEFGGLVNVNTQYVKGFQFAGITNISAKSENAIQVAGITNIAPKGSTKLQLSGLVNVAKTAKFQIGLVNIADSLSGAAFGLINVVKKNGKQEWDLGFSDAINTHLSYKLGTRNFYTIFSGGVNYLEVENADLQYAVGLGFGSEIQLKNNYATQIELLGYGLTENEEFSEDLNLLTQVKLTVSKELDSGLKLYAGPAFNMTISQVKKQNGAIGTDLAPYTIFEDNTNQTDLKGWVGFTIGLRY